MLSSSLSVLLPVLFVIALGYAAGRTKEFDSDQVKGINELVLDFALPAIMFVGIVKTAAHPPTGETAFLIATTFALLAFYIAVLLVSMMLLRRPIGEAALQACLVSFPSVAFMGIPIFKGLFGESGVLSVTTATVIANLTIAPLTVLLLEMHKQRTAKAGSGEVSRLGDEIVSALKSSFVKPVVWAPLAAILVVVSRIPVPEPIDATLTLIGSTTSGVSLFAAGLIIAAYKVNVSFEIVGNVITKMIAQPLFAVFLVWLFAVREPLGHELVLMCAIPSSAFAVLLAPRYNAYETEAASTLVLTSFAMVAIMPIAITLTGGM
ncbi:AEC family transporter [Pseudorhodoplanes sp.]|uniref:AEC family transporter n=1 Tax=Pseudorhodoplanes sp. TaxID=1934341 RepID=UPI002B8AB7F5|nr:AEC family transporter [Pseudorhodoplanes sp.]HWV55558.1 AEC family transporter [Pseudorhodoplanes sp.]